MGIFKRSPIPPQPMGAFVSTGDGLTASGSIYRSSMYADSTQLTLMRQQWQEKAYNLYDVEGHLYYAANYVGAAVGRLGLVAAKRPKKAGEHVRPEIIPEGAFADAVRNIRSPRGGQRGLLRSIGRNVFIAGEVWMIGSAEYLPDGSTSQSWDAVSISELVTATGGRFKRRRLPGQTGETLPDDALTIRIWKEHPRWSDLADSGVRSAMELLEKIVTLNRAERAIARSRLAGSGILALPQELVPPAWQNQADTPNTAESNPLVAALTESMMAPLENESHPSAVVPLLLVGPGDVIAKIKYEPMDRSFDTAGANASIKIAIEQVANTLELPKEVLLGMGEATRFTAWAIREDTFQAHIQPVAELTCDALTRTYLKQALSKLSPAEVEAAMAEAGIDDLNDVMVWYDSSQLIIRPDKAEQAGGLHDRFIISDQALRRETGYPETDKPSEEEYAKRVGIKMADPKMALTGVPTAPPPTATPGRPQETVNGPRGQSPQGPGAAAPKTPAERRQSPTTPPKASGPTKRSASDSSVTTG